jgi:DNA-binding SARP family transcriptional activator
MTPDTRPAAGPNQIDLCGTFRVQLDGRRVDQQLPGRGGRLAFAYLVISRGRAVSRDALAAAVWEDNAPRNPDSALRTLLTRLRSVVGPEVVSGRGEVILALPRDAAVDIEVAAEYLTQAERARAERDWQLAFESGSSALPILGADLLPTLHADWVELARRSHSELRIRALACVATAGLELGGDHLAAAEAAARRMVELEPLRESGHALMIRALAARGDHAQALVSYDELRQLLRDEIGAMPGRELRELHEQLLRGEETPAPSPAARHDAVRGPRLELPTQALAQATRPLFGRDAELNALLGYEFEAGGGESRTLALLCGEPGIGKSRLAAEYARRAHAHGVNVLWGSCHEDGFVPYEPFADVVRQYLGRFDDRQRAELLARTGAHVLELVPALSRGTPLPAGEQLDAAAARYRLFDAVAALLAEAARRRPVMLVLEDLHWADPATLMLLLHLHRVEERVPMAILATYRDAEVEPAGRFARALAELRRIGHPATIRLGGLSERHTRELVSALHGQAVTMEVSRGIYAQSEGNPFFVSEIVRCRADIREAGPSDVSDGVKDLITRRIANLSQDAVVLLHTAAVIGREFDHAILERVCRYEEEQMLELIEEAIGARVIEEVPGHFVRYSFCHALIREALYGELTRTRRARVHREIAYALSDDPSQMGPGGAAELAHHLHAAIADRAGALWAMQASVAAGDQAMSQYAYEDACAHYDRALGVVGQAGARDRERCHILLARGAALKRCGDGPAARAAFEQAAEIARTIGDGRRLASAALGFGGREHVPMSSGRSDPGLIRLIEEALLQLPQDARGLRARLLGRLSIELLWSPAGDRRTSLSGEAVELARESGDEAVIGYALAARRLATWSPANLADRLALSSETVAIAERIDDHELTLQGRQWLAADLLEAGDVEHAVEQMRLHARLAGRLRQPYHQWVAAGMRVARAQLAGRFKRAESLAELAYAEGARAHEDDAFEALSAQLFWIKRDQGRSGELGDLVSQSLARFEATASFWQAVAALHAAESGETKDAIASLERVADADGLAAIAVDPNWLSTVACLAEAACRAGQLASAAELYVALAPSAASNVVVNQGGISLGSASRYLGMLACVLGWWDRVEQHFEHALEFDTALAAPALLARTQHEYAEALRRRGRARDATRIQALAGRAAETAARLEMAALGAPGTGATSPSAPTKRSR